MLGVGEIELGKFQRFGLRHQQFLRQGADGLVEKVSGFDPGAKKRRRRIDRRCAGQARALGRCRPRRLKGGLGRSPQCASIKQGEKQETEHGQRQTDADPYEKPDSGFASHQILGPKTIPARKPAGRCREAPNLFTACRMAGDVVEKKLAGKSISEYSSQPPHRLMRVKGGVDVLPSLPS